jgi:hypothetical protein
MATTSSRIGIPTLVANFPQALTSCCNPVGERLLGMGGFRT